MANSLAFDMDLLSFPAMLLYLTAYFVVELIIKKAFQYFHPKFYDNLYRDRKDIQYFAFTMGILITIFSAPTCYKALQASSSTNDVLGNPNSSAAGQICLASRGVLWASELNRLDHSNKYITHHLASLGYLVYHLQSAFPLRIIYAFYASLITELFSTTACLVTLHGLKPESSKLAYRVQVTNWALLVIIRLPPSVYAATFLHLHSISDPVFWVNAACLAFYTRFNVNVIINVARRLDILKFVRTKPAYVKIGQRINISLYGFFFGVASFTGALLASKTYIQTSEKPLTSYEASRMNLQLLLTGLAAFLGARLPSVLAQNGFQGLLSSKLFTTRGAWIQCAMFTTALSVSISPLVDRYRLFLSFAMILPVGEAIGRVGCYFAGCCGDHRGKKISIQLQSALLNAVAGLSIMTLQSFALMAVERAAFLSLASNALIRVMLRPNTFALAQLMTAMMMLALRVPWKAPIADSVTTNSFCGDWNGTDAERLAISSTKSTIEVDFGTLKSPWTAILALSSLVAGSFVQGCSDSVAAQGCSDAADIPFLQGCSDSISAQGCSDAPEILRGCS